jgi:hypothetical protein
MASALEAATATFGIKVQYPIFLHLFLPAVQKTASLTLGHLPVSCSMPSTIDMNIHV